MLSKNAIVPGAALQPLDTNQEGLSLREAETRRGRLPAQHRRRKRWTKRSETWRLFISKCKEKEKRCFG
jgi:hypothetical protein